jgi:ABC-type branched-subunit amino acid transport system ATPase component
MELRSLKGGNSNGHSNGQDPPEVDVPEVDVAEVLKEAVKESAEQAHRPHDALLDVEEVTVRFGGVVANNNVSIWCRDATITALLGPNGAGKSTLFDVVTGARRPEGGRLVFDGHDVSKAPVHVRARLGMGRTFQNLAVVRDMSVVENVMLGGSRFRDYGIVSALLGLPKVRRTDRALKALAEKALEIVGLKDDAGLLAGSLPYGDLRRMEIARALTLGPKMLLLDEPAAGMDQAETADLSSALIQIRDQWGLAILVVEHDLDLVRKVAQDAFVLDFGVILAGGPIEQVIQNPAVVAAYLGTAHATT